MFRVRGTRRATPQPRGRVCPRIQPPFRERARELGPSAQIFKNRPAEPDHTDLVRNRLPHFATCHGRAALSGCVIVVRVLCACPLHRGRMCGRMWGPLLAPAPFDMIFALFVLGLPRRPDRVDRLVAATCIAHGMHHSPLARVCPRLNRSGKRRRPRYRLLAKSSLNMYRLGGRDGNGDARWPFGRKLSLAMPSSCPPPSLMNCGVCSPARPAQFGCPRGNCRRCFASRRNVQRRPLACFCLALHWSGGWVYSSHLLHVVWVDRRSWLLTVGIVWATCHKAVK